MRGSSSDAYAPPAPGAAKGVDVEELMIRAWRCSSDASAIPELGRQLTELLQAEVLDERVEFFLPQIAHLIVCLPAADPAAGLLERFALLVCERNVHVALQLSWAIYASLEDHAPGRPRADPRVYARCVRLLAHIEQSVVYGARLVYTARREAIRSQLSRTARAVAGHAAALAAAAKGGADGGGLGRPSDFPPASASASHALQREALHGGLVLAPGAADPAAAAAAAAAHAGASEAVAARPAGVSGVLWLVVGKPSAFYLSSLLGLSSDGFFRYNAWLSESTLYFSRRGYAPAASGQPDARARADGAIPLAHARIELRTSSRGYTYLYVGARFSKHELRIRPTGKGRAGLAELLAWRDALLKAAGRGVHDNQRVEAGSGGPVARRGFNLFRWLRRAARSLGRLGARLLARGRPAAQLVGAAASSRAQPSHRAAIELRALSPAQRRMYAFLIGQRDLAHALCSLAEELYTAPEPAKQLRERLRALQLPAISYLPTCRSADAFERLVRLAPDEAVVFLTQARASIMLFAEVLGSTSGRTVAELFGPAEPAHEQLPSLAALPRRAADGGAAERSPAGRRLLRPARTAIAAATAPLALARTLASGARDAASGGAQRSRSALEAAAARAKSGGTHKLDEPWPSKCARVRASSPRGGSSNWALRSVLCKANDDVRQEAFVMQLLHVLHAAFPPPLRLRPYSVLATGRACGLIETVVGARSLDHLKKRCAPGEDSLAHIFASRWGDDPAAMLRARAAFLHSLAAYCIASYLLQIRDRHNGNLLLADDGALVHIDFGFALGAAPGGRVGPETSAPFKLSAEMVELLGGPDSEVYRTVFPRLCTQALRAARTRARTLLALVEVMSLRPSLKCFVGAGAAPLEALRERLMLDVPDSQLQARVQALIDSSYNALGPNAYDRYQQLRNGIRA